MRLPSGFFRSRLDDRGIARRGYVFQPERDRVLARGDSQLVDELLAAEVDLRPDRIAQMRASERRTGVKERRDYFPAQHLVVGNLGFVRRPPNAVAVLRAARAHT